MRQPVGKERDERLQTIVNRPKPAQAKSSDQSLVQWVDSVFACAPASTLMTRPKSTGSANSATATATLASARSQPRRLSRPSFCEYLSVDVQKTHGTDCSRFSAYLLSAGGSGTGATGGGAGVAAGAAAGGAVHTL